MISSPLRLAVFDCDGTLVDSQGAIVAAMHEACERHGFARPDALAVRRQVGLPLEVAIERLLPDLDRAYALEISETYKSVFLAMRHAGKVSEPMFPGIMNVLDRLDASGWLMGVATGKAMRGLKNTLGHHALMDRFVTHQTADRAQGKPHPEMMLNAMNETGVGPGLTVMIGDTTYDMEMAANAGVKAVGVAWGYHETEELMDAGALCVVCSSYELLHALGEAVGQLA